MLILHVIASFNPVIGGPAEAIRNIVLEYNKIGIEAEIVCLDKPDADFLAEESKRFTVHALGHVDAFWFFSPTLKRWLDANISRFDTVIIHGLWLYPSFAVASFMRQLRAQATRQSGEKGNVPSLLIFPHGMLDPYFQRAAQRRIKAVRNWLYWKLIEGRTVHAADALLFTCETELLLARETFTPYQPKHEINIGYGIVNPPLYTESMKDAFLEKCPQAAGRSYLLFLSRIHDKKGVDLLLQAYADLVANHTKPAQGWPVLVVAGPGLDTPYGETIRELVSSLPVLNGLVHFPGMLLGKAKWGAIYGANAFLLPSHQENFGIAVAEALACSVPVLISNQVNIWREVLHGGGGLIDADTLDGTRRIMAQWLGLSPAKQQEMARNARKTFEHNFQMKQVIQRLNHVFETIR